MTVNRETYTELVHSMVWSLATNELTLGQISSVLFACAQENCTEETEDLTGEVRDALTDWSEVDKGQLVSCELVRMTFQCHNIHGPCDKGEHAVNMTRIIGSMGWEPENVTSTHDFHDVIMNVTIAHHPEGAGGKFVSSRRGGGGPTDLIDSFKQMFGVDDRKIESEVRDFRAELDALFPSAPSTQEKGGSDDTG